MSLQLKDFVCPQAILIALVLGSIIVGTVIGNILVCVAVFLVRKLRRPCNYLLVSLAVSDLCVALLVMPMALLYEISGNWSFGAIMCDLWVSFDVLSCTASILNLCMISVDRWVASIRDQKFPAKIGFSTDDRVWILVEWNWIIQLPCDSIEFRADCCWTDSRISEITRGYNMMKVLTVSLSYRCPLVSSLSM